MKAKSVLYAAVGAPVVAARKVSSKTTEVYGKLNERATGYGESAEKAIDTWAAEGEKVITRVKDGKVVDEITSKVDLDQAKEQVSKLRDQLEDMLATWRGSFRPEKAEGNGKAEEKKAPAAKTSTKSTAKTTAKTSAKTTAKTSAAKTSGAQASEAPAAEPSSEKNAAGEADQAS